MMTEAVRLVIWDLDETFWRGTLSEGGITHYVQANHDIVVTLAQRGIMSSMCSKNDAAAVRAVLVEHGIWDYFVFPSVDWSAKGVRIRALIDAMQLRPATVMFIDDNASNRVEAASLVPELRVADPSILPALLDDPHFSGKHDPDLTRLAQYKVLERRAGELGGGDPNNEAFLRESDIRVFIDPDVESHVARAVELINRTNQLNFTKVRLPADLAAATDELLAGIQAFDVQAGLIRVVDNYGDYGYCGFYRLRSDRLLDYCFSCRILGLGVETWLYQKLGRPALEIVPDVAVDPTTARDIDWIRVAEFGDVVATDADMRLGTVRVRGGCELESIAHYFRMHARSVSQETNLQRGPFFIYENCTPLTLIANTPGRSVDDLMALGFAEWDIRSEFLAPAPDETLLVYSGWADVYRPHFRHRDSGDLVSCQIVGLPDELLDLSVEDLEAALREHGYGAVERERVDAALAHLRAQFEAVGVLTEEDLAVVYAALFDRVPGGATLVVLLPATTYKNGDGQVLSRGEAIAYNAIVRRAAAGRGNVRMIEVDGFVHSANEVDGVDHFSRIVYFRVFRGILGAVTGARTEG
jgi:FkbH-like protein